MGVIKDACLLSLVILIIYAEEYAEAFVLPLRVRKLSAVAESSIARSMQSEAHGDEVVGWDDAQKAMFVKEYWQKKPLMIRQAFPKGQLQIPSKGELLELSVDDDVESRLLQFDKNTDTWKKRTGPFERSFLSSLKKDDVWTLLVQEVDRHVPAVADIWERFGFIPGWRRDDVMISYATPGGGIGAHVDNYDVFLIQGKGEREWSIENSFLTNEDELAREVKGAQTRLLTRFKPDQSWLLQEGDMLYLPPRVPHCGVSASSCGSGSSGSIDCTTVSMGFRAPSFRSMMVAFTSHLCLTNTIDRNHYYTDPDLWQHDTDTNNDTDADTTTAAGVAAGCVSAEAREKLASTLQYQFSSALADDAVFDRWMGTYLTEPLRMHIRPPVAFFLQQQNKPNAEKDKGEGDNDYEDDEDADGGDYEEEEEEELPLAVSSRHAVASQTIFADAEAVAEAAFAGNVQLRLCEGVRRAYLPRIKTLFLNGEAYPVPPTPQATAVAALLASSVSRVVPVQSLRSALDMVIGKDNGGNSDSGTSGGGLKQSSALRFLCGVIRSGYFYPVDAK